ncbi:MAG: FAD binding domain-containing protein [Alphaproteobacteria bacterium]
MTSYLRPSEVAEALDALAGGGRTIVAGGTDFYPARVGRPLDDDVLDVSGLDALRGITGEDGRFRIGALATWSDLIETPLPPCFDGLKLAAREVGGVQVQNAGTVCGNVCNASPAADGVPGLLTLDAVVEAASRDGVREVPLAEFVTGNRETKLRRDELVTGLLIPKPRGPTRSTFLKLGARTYLVISIVMVAAVIEAAGDGTVATARVAVGACSPVARRLHDLEAALAGRRLDGALGEAAQAGHLACLSPIDDIRGSAAYRLDAALTLVRRALNGLGGTT